MEIRVKVHNSFFKKVSVVDKDCPKYKCFNPHDCSVQGAGGVRSSKERWMCLTNFYNGCPDEKILKKDEKEE